MSFQEGERPTRPVRPRGQGPQEVQQTILMRRLIAGGAAILILILLFVGLKSCLNSRKDSAYRSYATDVNALLASSNAESKALFQALSTPPKNGASDATLDVQNIVNTQAQDAKDLVSRAEELDHPGELDAANNWLVQTLEFRAGALDQIADSLPAALGDKDTKPAIDKIAGQMQAIVSSDVIYLQRAYPDLISSFEERGISEQFPQTRFLPTDQILTWLDPKGVEDQLAKVSGGASDEEATPGLHGTGIGAVTVGGTELTEGDVNRVAVEGAPTFEVQVENQGDSEETQVQVTVTVAGGKAITAKQSIPRVAAGEAATAVIPLGQAPSTDGVSTVKIEVAPVPGEGTKDNNSAEYEVAFTG